MDLGSRAYAQNDVRRITIDYSGWLARGITLSTATITFPTGTVSTVGSQGFSPNEKQLWFYVNCGAVNESFAAAISVTDTSAQEINDLLIINVVSATQGEGVVQPPLGVTGIQGD